MNALFYQEFKNFFKSASTIFIFVIPLILLIGMGFYIPESYIIPSTISLGVVSGILIYFGGNFEELKRTSFLKLIATTKITKLTILIVKVLFAIFISLLIIFVLLFFSWLFSSVFPILATDFGNINESLRFINGELIWSDINWFLFIYAIFMSLAITITLTFVFVSFSKSEFSFYLLSFGYICVLALFGGVVIPTFLLVHNHWFGFFRYLVPNYYSANFLVAAFNNSLSNRIDSILSYTIIGNISITDLNPEIIKDLFFMFGYDKITPELLISIETLIAVIGDSSSFVEFKRNFIAAFPAYDSSILIGIFPIFERWIKIVLPIPPPLITFKIFMNNTNIPLIVYLRTTLSPEAWDSFLDLFYYNIFTDFTAFSKLLILYCHSFFWVTTLKNFYQNHQEINYFQFYYVLNIFITRSNYNQLFSFSNLNSALNFFAPYFLIGTFTTIGIKYFRWY